MAFKLFGQRTISPAGDGGCATSAHPRQRIGELVELEQRRRLMPDDQIRHQPVASIANPAAEAMAA